MKFTGKVFYGYIWIYTYMFTRAQTYQLWHDTMVPLGWQLSQQKGRHDMLSLSREASRAAETSSHSSKALLMLWVVQEC